MTHCGAKLWLDPSEIAEVCERARHIMQRYPRQRGRKGAERSVELKALADDYRITVRTLQRYLRRTA